MSVLAAVMVPHPPIILPEIGHGEESKIQKTIDAYREAMQFLASFHPDTVVITSPHTVMYRDYFHISPGRSARGDFRQFRAPEVKLFTFYDQEFVATLSELAKDADIPAGTLGERDPALDHGTMIPLRFFNEFADFDYHTVRIGLSGLALSKHYELGKLIQKTADMLDRRVCLIASGDLSHKLKKDGPYGLDPAGPMYDERIMRTMGSGNFSELFDYDDNFCSDAAECGHRSFVIMAGALCGYQVEAKQLSHEDTFGVGYGVCTYEVKKTNEGVDALKAWRSRQSAKISEQRAKEDAYVHLARVTVEQFIRGNGMHRATPEELSDPAMSASRAGVFVSIHEDGNLRGCIGTIRPAERNIASEIIHNAISAATRDPRFDTIQEDELDKLEYSVDVLSPTERISSPAELDVKNYGVIVSKNGLRGLLLPNLDGVDTVEKQLRIAKQKAGIDPDDPDVELQRFRVVRHY